MPKVLSLYLDDSGTRNPDRKLPSEFMFRDWFTLGGFVINEEDEGIARTSHERFCGEWGITYPLHSYDIRANTGDFAWLKSVDSSDYRKFMTSLSKFLIGLPILGHACVIDRPGYNARYREKYGRQTWMLCQTAFSVVCERAAKHAIKNKRKLRVYVEDGDPSADGMIKKYYASMKKEGMPFAGGGSAHYAPLSQEELNNTLYDLKFKKKSSPMAQIADLYTYPIARGGYDPEYGPYTQLKSNCRLLDCLLTGDEVPHLGIKYSCFELAIKNKKSRG